MKSPAKRTSLLCPNCKKLVSRDADKCPYCNLKNPGSFLKNNPLTRQLNDQGNIIRIILFANIIMFALSIIIDPRLTSFSSNPFSFLSPSSNSLLVLGSTGTVPLFQFNRWWSLISASYLHGSLMHILFNMIALHQLGPLIIQEYGKHRTIILYTASGIGGYLISSFFGVNFTIGASAAVCGLIGAALFYGKSRGGTYGNAVYSQISGWVIGIFLFGFIVPGINNWGHGGGLLTGALLGFILGYTDKVKERMIHKYIAMVCLTGTGLVLFWSVIQGAAFLYFRISG